jgi:hypothetical protein
VQALCRRHNAHVDPGPVCSPCPSGNTWTTLGPPGRSAGRKRDRNRSCLRSSARLRSARLCLAYRLRTPPLVIDRCQVQSTFRIRESVLSHGVYLLDDAFGRPLGFLLTGGQDPTVGSWQARCASPTRRHTPHCEIVGRGSLQGSGRLLVVLPRALNRSPE